MRALKVKIKQERGIKKGVKKLFLWGSQGRPHWEVLFEWRQECGGVGVQVGPVVRSLVNVRDWASLWVNWEVHGTVWAEDWSDLTVFLKDHMAAVLKSDLPLVWGRAEAGGHTGGCCSCTWARGQCIGEKWSDSGYILMTTLSLPLLWWTFKASTKIYFMNDTIFILGSRSELCMFCWRVSWTISGLWMIVWVCTW